MSSTEDTKNITAMLVLEAIGKPKEHLVKVLEELKEQIEKEPGVKLIDSKVHEPKVMEKKEGFFTTFAEIEVEVNDPLQLSILMFKYMPAHVEVIEPEQIKISNGGYSEILSELTRRLHGYDEIARVMQMEKKVLENKIKELEKK